MESQIGAKLAEYGVLGIMVLLCLLAIVRLMNELTAERTGRREDAEKKTVEIRDLQDKRIADQAAYTSKLLEINTTVHATVDKLADVVDHISKSTRRTRDV